MEAENDKRFYEFGPFRLDAREFVLLRDGQNIALTPKVFETLLVLVENSGHIVDKNEFYKRVWQDAFVEETNLTKNISILRKILGEDDPEIFFIETVPKRGYRFVAPVTRSGSEKSETGAGSSSVDVPAISAEIGAEPAESSVEHAAPKNWLHDRRVFVVLTAIFIIVIAVVAATYRYSDAAGLPIDSVAVLPFVNISGDSNTEYLSDGISEALINSLTQIQQLRVAARHSAFRYKGKEIDPQAVGKELNVRAVLMGRVRQSDDTLNIQMDLIDVTTGAQLWGKEYERKISEVLALKQEIAREITENLRLQLSREEQRQLVKRDTTNAEAYQLYLKGRFFWNKYTEEGFRKSIEYFKEAVEKDPSYALAYSGLADSYSLLGEQAHAPPKDTFPLARTYAEKALLLDETLADAHISLGIVKLFFDWDWPGVDIELRRAKELDPTNPQVYHFYGHYLQIVGRSDEAIPETIRAVNLEPTSLILNAELGWAYYCARRYDQAIERDRKTLELDPSFVYASWVIAQSYAQTGQYNEAAAELKRAGAIDPNWAYIAAELAYASASSGERPEAERILRQLTERSKKEYIDSILIAYVYVGLGQKDQAFVWLEKAHQERSGLMPWLKGEPKWDPLREDERFTELLLRMGVAD
jgi:TolB-like protein/DNA-binding winged helix-turn-helix (wHTH) protein/Tfp pilus assembly protein PilF